MPSSPVVLGGGIAGIAAAAALRQFHTQVTVVERDILPASPRPRRGVPQGNHLHNILGRAQKHLDALLPGFSEALEASGAIGASVADETHVYEFGRLMPRVPLGMRLICAPRPVIEHTARELLVQLGGIEIIDGARACGLRTAAREVVGVEIERAGQRQHIPTRLVVDATGTTSRSHDWLAELGVAAPRQTLQPGQWYATTEFASAPSREFDPAFYLTFPTSECTLGALASPLGAARWQVSVSGRQRDPAPDSVEDVLRLLRALPDPTISQLLEDASAVSQPTVFRKNTATWWRVDQIEDPVAGLLPLGDAVASLNPLLGQGMSVAAWEADLLASAMRRLGGAAADVLHLTHDYLRSTELPVGTAWTIGDQVDEALGRPADGDYGWLVERLARDPETHRLYVRVWHLLEPAAKLQGLNLLTTPSSQRST